jgi:hypothetical protein
MFSLALDVAVLVAAVALGLAFYKHHTLAGVVASAKRELVIIEASLKAAGASAAADLSKLKALLGIK